MKKISNLIIVLFGLVGTSYGQYNTANKKQNTAVNISIGIKNPNVLPFQLCPMGYEYKKNTCLPIPSKVYCQDGKKIIMHRYRGQLINVSYTNEPCNIATFPGNGEDYQPPITAKDFTKEIKLAKVDINVLSLQEISNLYIDELPKKSKFEKCLVNRIGTQLSLSIIYKTDSTLITVNNELKIDKQYLQLTGIPQLIILKNNQLITKELKSVRAERKQNDYVGHVTLLR